MFDTHVTIVGNVLHEPEWRKTTNTGALVTTFKLASTARRRDRSGNWVDGNSLRVRVNCWRTLASNVKESVTRGDPLVVTGRLFTRDWIDEHGVKRTQFELEANAVGHDLSRGRVVFERRKQNSSTSAIEDAESERRIGGELTEPVPDEEAPSQFDDTEFASVHQRSMDPPPYALDDSGPVGADPPEFPLAGADDDPLLVADSAEPAEPGELAEPTDPGEANDPGALAEPAESREPITGVAPLGAGRRRGSRRARPAT